MSSKIIRNGPLDRFTDWYDDEGNVINASDGGILYAEGVYYWYGLELRALPADFGGKGGQTTTTGVVMYSSPDLVNWHREGIVLSCSTDPESPLYAPMRFERPKIVYNEAAGKYVLWCHYVGYPGDHGDTPGTAEAGVAVSDRITGPYRFLGTTRPIDDRGLVRDCTVYKDADGSAYYIYDRQEAPDNRCQHIVKLSADYLSMTAEYRRLDEVFWREAAAVVFHDGRYFMITSDLTSWKANQARYYRAENLFGPWEVMGDPCVDDVNHDTFFSQSTYIFRVEGKSLPDGSPLWIHMAERHNTENFLHCSYIWLPVRFTDDHRLYLAYEEEWELP